MKIFLGADHRGFAYKEKVKKILMDEGHSVVDVGPFNDEVPCDYPITAYRVATNVAKARNSMGILACMSGIGQAIAANKVKGAYAALCYNSEAAALSRQHNNANILVLSAKFITPNELKKIINIWLKAEFEGGRHLRRFKQIKRIESGVSP